MWNLVPWKQRNEERGGSSLAERPQDFLMQMRQDLDSLFDRYFGNWTGLTGGDRPALGGQWPMPGGGLDVDDKENEIVVRADTPGFELNDFNIEVVGDNLVLKAQRKEEQKKGDGHYYREGRLYRTVALPRGVEAEKIDARYRNGVLEIHVPKGEQAKGKRIAIKAT